MVIKTSEPKVLLKLKCILGEGTLWVKEHNAIYFVDIKKHKIYVFNVKNKKTKESFDESKNLYGIMPKLLKENGLLSYRAGIRFLFAHHFLLIRMKLILLLKE